MTGRTASETPRSPQKPPSGSGPRRPPETPQPRTWNPPPMSSIDDTGLNMLQIADLILKVLYFSGFMTGHQVAN